MNCYVYSVSGPSFVKKDLNERDCLLKLLGAFAFLYEMTNETKMFKILLPR